MSEKEEDETSPATRISHQNEKSIDFSNEITPPDETTLNIEWVDVMAQDSAGNSALMLAAASNRPKMVDLIIKRATSRKLLADVLTMENSDGETAFTIALKHGNNQCADLISESSCAMRKQQQQHRLPSANSIDHGYGRAGILRGAHWMQHYRKMDAGNKIGNNHRLSGSDSLTEMTGPGDIDAEFVNENGRTTTLPPRLSIMARCSSADAPRLRHTKSAITKNHPVRMRSGEGAPQSQSNSIRARAESECGPALLPPACTSTVTPESNMIFTLGERLRALVNMRREREINAKREHQSLLGNQYSSTEASPQKTSTGDEYRDRKQNNDTLMTNVPYDPSHHYGQDVTEFAMDSNLPRHAPATRLPPLLDFRRRAGSSDHNKQHRFSFHNA